MGIGPAGHFLEILITNTSLARINSVQHSTNSIRLAAAIAADAESMGNCFCGLSNVLTNGAAEVGNGVRD